MGLTSCQYYGGKAREGFRAWLKGLIPCEKDGLYCEPFGGMLGLLLSRPRVSVEIVNDLDGHVFNFWCVVRESPEALARRIKYTVLCRRTYEYAWSGLHEGKLSGVEGAWALFVLLNHGVMSSHGRSGWRHFYTPAKNDAENFALKIDALYDRVKDVQVENKCAVELMDRLSGFFSCGHLRGSSLSECGYQSLRDGVCRCGCFDRCFSSSKGSCGDLRVWNGMGSFRV